MTDRRKDVHFKGTGELAVGGDTLTRIAYDIHVRDLGGRHEGSGCIEGEPAELQSALRAGEAALILPDGKKIKIVVTNHIKAERNADVVTLGPVPLE